MAGKKSGKNAKEIVVVLSDIRSIYNTASVFRTADGAGVKKIYLCGTTPAPTDVFGKTRPRFAKVSLGAEKSVEWDSVARSPRAILKLLKRLRGDGYKILAVEQSKNSVPYYKIRGIRMNSPIRIALVFGNEIRGLPPPVLKLADKILEIPMRGALVCEAGHPRHSRGKSAGKESLNVSVAAGIILYHFAI